MRINKILLLFIFLSLFVLFSIISIYIELKRKKLMVMRGLLIFALQKDLFIKFIKKILLLFIVVVILKRN